MQIFQILRIFPDGDLQMAPRFRLLSGANRPDLPDGDLHFFRAEHGLRQFDPDGTFPACEAVALGDAAGPGISGQKEIMMKLHVHWGHASAPQLNV